MKPTVGVECMAVHIPKYYVDLRTLARANRVDQAKYYLGLGGRRMAIVAPSEDSVTMAAEASLALLNRYQVDPEQIGLLVVGTESGVDGAKPVASFVHRLVGLPGSCRTFDTKHACYSATAAMRMAADWCTVHSDSDRPKALVVASDVARYDVGSAGEPTQGAGAVALLIGCEPASFILDPYPEAVFTEEVMDFWRPHYRREAVVNGQVSVDSYLKALDRTYAAYEESSGLKWDDYDFLLFHVPYPKMAQKAFRLLYQREEIRRRGNGGGLLPFEQAFNIRTQPALWANMEVGNIYSGSLYLSLASLLEGGDRHVEGARVGLFSYGSGCCAEFFSGRIGSRANKWRDKIGISRGLSNRIEIDHSRYLQFRKAGSEMSRDCSYPHNLAESSHLTGNVAFQGIRDHQRMYASFSDQAEEPVELVFDLGSVCQTSGQPLVALSNSASAQIGKYRR